MVEIHHCMGRIADAGITFFARAVVDHCGRCGMVTNGVSGHCCKAEYKLVKISDDQKPASEINQVDAPAVAILSLGWPECDASIPDNLTAQVFYIQPPPPLSPSRQSLLCVFRI